MSEELRACPLCPDGGNPVRLMFSVFCTKCGLQTEDDTLATDEEIAAIWNTRPIEDALTARIAELEAEEIHVEWMSEDKLPEGISDEVFSAMYACSKVDFVRFYPFVTIDGDKCFLIKLPEVK